MAFDKRVFWALLAALALRIALFFSVPITGDAIFHYNFTKFMAENLYVPSFEISVGAGALPYFHPPLQHLLGVPLYWINPSLPFIAPIIYGIIGLFFLYKLTRLLFGEKIAIYSLAIAAVFPPLLYYSAINYTDSLMFACITGAFYFYFSYFSEGGKSRRNLALTLLFSAFALLTHYHGIAVPAVLAFHSFFHYKKPKLSLLLILIPLLIASPWYIRNYALYGNPVFPVFNIGLYPNAQYDLPSFSQSVSSLALPQNWFNIFLEFLIGGPNSGDAYIYLPGLAEKFPFAYLFAFAWLITGILLAIIFLRGISLLLQKSRFLIPFFVFLLALCTFFIIQTPYPRMYFSLIPLIMAGGAFGIIEAKNALARSLPKALAAAPLIILLILALGMLAVPFAYAITYKSFFEKHLEYYALIRQNTPPDAVVLSNSPERMIFYAGRLANYFDDVKGRVPSSVLYSKNMPRLKDYGITHVCYTNLLSASPAEKEFYVAISSPPTLEYSSGAYFGKCWKLGG